MKILQFGEGNFLRSFVDLYLDTLNKEKLGNFDVTIVKPIAQGSLEKFYAQNCKYNVVLRGRNSGKDVEDVYPVDCVKRVLNPFEDNKEYYEYALDAELKIVISNTTEAGICFDPNDKFETCPDITFPAKVTKFLFKRFKAGLPGLYFLPVELIENNADELYKCVDSYITLWNLGEDFRKWNNEENVYCNTLVDRIVSGYPRDVSIKEHLFDLIGYKDELVSIGEPFGLWVIQDKKDISKLLFDGHHNIDVIFAKDISYYKKRKVRVLNGSHTNLVPISLWLGKETVFDVMNDSKTFKFVCDTLDNDINPFVGDDIEATKKFSNDVLERFKNPFLNHQLSSISLNSISKWKARVLPSFEDYYAKNHAIPRYLTIGFSYLVNMYMNIQEVNGAYICHLPNKDLEVKDEIKYLTYFNENHSILDFMKDTSIWGVDLSNFTNFVEEVEKNVIIIKQGGSLI